MLLAGLNGGTRNGAAALVEDQRLIGVCAQERVTRVRGGGIAAGLPTDALDLMLQRGGRSRSQVDRFVVVDADGVLPVAAPVDHVEHHRAHAGTAYLSSPFTSAAIVICDLDAPGTSVWTGRGATMTRADWPVTGPGFVGAYSRVAAALGFRTVAATQLLEALARLQPDARDADVDALFAWRDGTLIVDAALERRIEDRMAGAPDAGTPQRARLAAAAQARLGELLLELLRSVRARLGETRLCVGGSFFYNSFLNALVRRSRLFDEVFVPIDPGNSGLAVGAALSGIDTGPSPVSPFLGPTYSAEEVKGVLDNCKLRYSWASEESIVRAAVSALREGRLVGWFDGGMEWGRRALGARCILASPTSPYVLENLNRFLKQRESWRGYALSGTEEAVAEHFDGPIRSPFMECDFRPRDPDRFRYVLPTPQAAVRVHTVAGDGLPRFARLLQAVGDDCGLPLLVNTSFNGFHEPLVCSPRDAVRVFYGSGLDLLVMNQFVLEK